MKTALTLATVGALALSLAACSSGSGSSGGSNSSSGAQKYANGKTFTMAIASDPGTLDPQLSVINVAVQLDRFLYDTLVQIDSKGQEQPRLAAKWSGNTTNASFTLRKGITCSDGSPLTATDVAKNINFVADPANKSPFLGVLVQPGAKASADDTTGTVTVESKAPDPFLTRDLGSLDIVCAKGMADRSSLKQGADGTGPYTLTDVVPDDHYTLTKRAGYNWGPGNFSPSQPGMPAKVVMKVVSNESTAANLMLSGQVNATQIVGADRQRLSNKSGVSELDFLAPLGEIWFNQKAGEPTADVAVRKALVQALDLKQLGQVTTGGTGKPATGLIATGSGPCSGDSVTGSFPSFDVNAAKSGLDAAGWKVGAGGVRTNNGKKLSINFYYPTGVGSGVEAAAELVQKSWQAIGADVSLKGMTDAQAGQYIVAGQSNWNVTLLPLTVSVPTQLVGFLSGPSAPKGANFANIQNKQYSAAVQKASTEAGTAGCPDWKAAEKALFQNVDVLPYVLSSVPVFVQGATLGVEDGTIISPTSIRMFG
jgi:peptide/nickel transport system substrate-binding protein